MVRHIRPQSFADGLKHLLAFTNFYSGKDSLGDKIMDKTMFLDGPVYNPWTFASGMAAGLAAEIAVPTYLIAASDLKWYAVLGADLVIKTVPRLVDYTIRSTMRDEENQTKGN